jgi:hypothetical protein
MRAGGMAPPASLAKRHAHPPRHAVGARRTKEVNAMFKRSKSSPYQRAVSFKWLVGLILILGALYAYFVNHDSLLGAAILFGIGVILA